MDINWSKTNEFGGEEEQKESIFWEEKQDIK